MTIEKLLENTPEFLESLTYEQLYKHLEPYLVITRPELAPKPVEKKKTGGSYVATTDPKKMTKMQKQRYAEQLMNQFLEQQKAAMKAKT